MSHTDLFIDGYVSQSFRPNKDAETYLCHLLKTDPPTLKQSYLTLPTPTGSGALFAVRALPDTLSPEPLMQDGGSLLWLLDYRIVPTGTVVPQVLWSPQNVNDFRQYVAEAPLQMPIFFAQNNGVLGLSLDDAANGRCKKLRDAEMQAHLGGKTTTHIRIWWPGYKGFKRQVQIRDETPAKNPVIIAKFAHHVGRCVDAFLRDRVPNETRKAGDDHWIIGQGGIDRTNIRIIGAIHVSSGSWMPILQLDTWVF